MHLTARAILYGHHSPSIIAAACQTCLSGVPTALNDSGLLGGRGKMNYYYIAKYLGEIKGLLFITYIPTTFQLICRCWGQCGHDTRATVPKDKTAGQKRS